MVYRRVCALEVNIGEEAILLKVGSVFQCQLEVGYCASAGAAFAETFLWLRDNLVGLCIFCANYGEHTCPEFVESRSKGNGAVVAQVRGVAFFVDKDGCTVHPGGRRMASDGHALE